MNFLAGKEAGGPVFGRDVIWFFFWMRWLVKEVRSCLMKELAVGGGIGKALKMTKRLCMFGMQGLPTYT